MKKKQADFQKVKLKVGKHLPKGQNVTNTSFQTKKIVTQEQSKSAEEKASLNEILRCLSSNDVRQKLVNLSRLRVYVEREQDTLSMFFPEVLKKMSSCLTNFDNNVRSDSIKILAFCFNHLTESQFLTFSSPIAAYLGVMMTHIRRNVRQDSLKLLDSLLRSHPSIIHCSTQILQDLLNMMSVKIRPAQKSKGKKRKLSNVVSDSVSGEEWTMKVLAHIEIFLETLLKDRNTSQDFADDQKEVYWDAKEPLYLPLYFNSGTTPAKLDYSAYSMQVEVEITDSKDFEKFIEDLIPLLSEALTGLSTYRTRAPSITSVRQPRTIVHLNIIAQVLCYIGEWIHSMNHQDPDSCQQFRFIICYQLMKGFPYSQHSKKSGAKADDNECLQLNLSICYLYYMFITDLEEDKVIYYFSDCVRVSRAKDCEKSIALTLKILKLLIQSKKLTEGHLNGMLLGIITTLDIIKLSPLSDDLYSFIIDLSLNHEYRSLLETEAMTTWHKTLPKELTLMMNKKRINKKVLKYIELVCARRYPPFMEILNSFDQQKLFEFLLFDNEDFQRTVIHLIASLNSISSELLENLAYSILEGTISSKIAVRLIRLLNCRYLRTTNAQLTEKIFFVKFLLNVGCDSVSIISQPKYELMPYTIILQQGLQRHDCKCLIYPVPGWDKYFKLTEVCIECLSFHGRNELIERCIAMFVESLLDKYIIKKQFILPIQSAVAFLELRNKVAFGSNSPPLYTPFLELLASCLVYISVATTEIPPESYRQYTVSEIQNRIGVVEGVDIIGKYRGSLYKMTENEFFHCMRIVMFLHKRGSFKSEDKNSIYKFLDDMAHPPGSMRGLQESWLYIVDHL